MACLNGYGGFLVENGKGDVARFFANLLFFSSVSGTAILDRRLFRLSPFLPNRLLFGIH
jgi:hypothetical protein